MVETSINQTPLLTKLLQQYQANKNSIVFVPLAEAYRKVGQTKDALRVLREGLKQHPTYQSAYVVLGNCYLDMGELQLAYSTLKPFVSTNRENIKIQKLFSTVAYKLGESDEALEALKYILFINPRDKEAQDLTSELEANLSPVKSNVKTNQEEWNFKVEGIKQDPSLDDWIQVELNSEKVAENDLKLVEIPKEKIEKKQSIDPKSSLQIDNKKAGPDFVTHTLVDLYLAQNHKDKALELLKKIHEIHPDDKRTLERMHLIEQEISGEQELVYQIESQIYEQPTINKSEERSGELIQKVLLAGSKFLQEITRKSREYQN